MPRFRHYNYDQHSMVVINYQDQLQPGTSFSTASLATIRGTHERIN